MLTVVSVVGIALSAVLAPAVNVPVIALVVIGVALSAVLTPAVNVPVLALVAAALSISGLSDAFTQDMENEDFMNNAKTLLASDDPESPVSTAQIRRLYAIGGNVGLTTKEVKDLLAAKGYTSTKQIKQQDYESVCNLIQNYKKENNNGNSD